MENEFRSGAIYDPKPTDFNLGMAFSSDIPNIYLPDISWFKRHFQGNTPRCFVAGTMVKMNDGTFKNIEDVRFGDEIIDAYGNPSIVVKTHKNYWQGGAIKITAFGNCFSTTSTKEHPFMTQSGWKQAKDITEKDRLYIPIDRRVIDKTDFYYENDKDFLKVLGLYLAEGFAESETYGAKHSRVKFTMNKDEIDIIRYIYDVMHRIFGIKGIIKIEKNTSNIEFNYKRISDIFIELGGNHAKNKSLNRKLLFLRPDLQKYIFDGWMVGDGTETKGKFVGKTISKNLALQMYNICLRNNIVVSVTVEKSKVHNDGILRQDAYSISIPKNSEKLRGEINGNFLIRKVRYVEKIKAERGVGFTVYNLSVSGTNTYTANLISVHNCGAFSMAHLAQILQHNDKTAEQIELSPAWAWKKIKSIDGFPPEEGTSSRAIFKVLSSMGIAPYGTVSEDNNLDIDTYTFDNTTEESLKEAHKRICGAYGFKAFPSFEDAKQAISLKGGAILLLRGDNGFWRNKYPTFEETKWGHFVVATGYTEDHIRIIDSAEPNDDFGEKFIDKKYFPSKFCVEVSSAFDVSDERIQIMDKLIELYREVIMAKGYKPVA